MGTRGERRLDLDFDLVIDCVRCYSTFMPDFQHVSNNNIRIFYRRKQPSAK
jgi:hypothetical protein